MIALFLSTALQAAEPVAPINADPRTHVAIEGADVVAYFEQGESVKGSPEHTVTHNGAVWRFSTEAHRDAFAADPERFVPQYGGYCAWAVGNNYTAEIDPDAWRIVDGRLYLNYSPKIQRRWESDRDALIKAADQNWPGLIASPTP